MGTRLGRSSRARVCAVLVATGVAFAVPAAAASRRSDVQIAKSAVFVLDDFPEGFTSEPSTSDSHAENLTLAKGVSGCAPYVALQKAVMLAPQMSSPDFQDSSRRLSNEVDVFKSDRAASDALALYAKPSIIGCLQKIFQKQLRQDPDLKGKVKSAAVTVERKDIAGLGDDSVVYEGEIVLTGTDGSNARLQVGSAAVQVGRAVNVVSFSASGGDLTEILTPAIDASVGRLRTALVGGTA